MKKIFRCLFFGISAILLFLDFAFRMDYYHASWSELPAIAKTWYSIQSLCLIAIFAFFLWCFIDTLLDILSNNEKIKARRKARAAARAQKAEADKQKRIEELQSELDELKKGE